MAAIHDGAAVLIDTIEAAITIKSSRQLPTRAQLSSTGPDSDKSAR
jgi:hypothetical protein